MAVPIVVSGSPDVLAAPESMQVGSTIGLLVVLGLAFVMYKLATGKEA